MKTNKRVESIAKGALGLSNEKKVIVNLEDLELLHRILQELYLCLTGRRKAPHKRINHAGLNFAQQHCKTASELAEIMKQETKEYWPFSLN